MSVERLEVAASGLSSVMKLYRYYRPENERKKRKSKEKVGRRDKKITPLKSGKKSKQRRKDTT